MISISQSKLTEVFNRLYSWIGSFWSKIYTDPAFIQHIQEGRALRVAQLYLDLLENLKLMDRRNLPVFHRERWYPIIIRKSEEGTGDINSLRMGEENHAVIGEQGEGSIYGEGTELYIGTAAKFLDVETYPIHGKVDNVVTCIVDSIINPKTILRKGTDFILGYNCIGIYKEHSPFKGDSTFPKFEMIDKPDVETVLWGCDAIIDQDYVNDYLGYIIGAAVESSESGKNIVNSYWDMLNYANPQYLSELLGNLCHVPFIKEDEETVATVLENAVITDKNVYRFDDYTPEYRDKIVSGAKLKRGEYLDTAIKILPFLTDLSKNMEFDPQEVLPEVYIPAAITRDGIGFSVTWEEMAKADFGAKYGVSTEICNQVAVDGKIVPAKFFLENLIGANTLFIILDSAKLKDAPIYQGTYYKLVEETVPKYIRVAMISSASLGSDDETNEDDADDDGIEKYGWKGAESETDSGDATDAIAYRFISTCARL